MAKEDVEAGAEESGGKKKGGMLMLLIVGLVGAVAGGGGAYFALGSQAPAEAVEGTGEEAAEAAEQADEKAKESAADFDAEDLAARQLDLAPFVVNITDEGLSRYLKVKLSLELRLAEEKPQVEAYESRIRDAIIVLLSTKRLADLNQFEGKLLLKDEMRDRINALFGNPFVRSVLLTEFVVQ